MSCSALLCGQQVHAVRNGRSESTSSIFSCKSRINRMSRMQQSLRGKNGPAFVNAAAATDKIPARPDSNGRYGQFGGKYVPETLIAALEELEKAYAEAMADESFKVCVCQKNKDVGACWRVCVMSYPRVCRLN